MTWLGVLLGVIALTALTCVAFALLVIDPLLVVCSEAKDRQDACSFRSDHVP